ncbi:MAG TPA: histidine kinase, partial [Dehalococcoidia bacterium]|nr:histidine kinase [Dehalococcoidia bacterium]
MFSYRAGRRRSAARGKGFMFKQGWALAKGIAARIARLTLFQAFAVFSIAVFLVGALAIGRYMAGEVKSGVIGRTGAVTALYVDSFISPYLQELAQGGAISWQHVEELDSLLQTTPLGNEIAALKVWSLGGDVLYAHDRRLLGQHFPENEHVQEAAQGRVLASLSRLSRTENVLERQQYSRLLEVYAPVYRAGGDQVIAVAEFYQRPDDLLSAINSAQWRGWLMVGLATLAMYLLLVGLVRRASNTIATQHRRLRGLAAQNALLAKRLQRVAAQKVETDERLLRRVAQDLHDGPAQDLSLALLRIAALRQAPVEASSNGSPSEEDFRLVQTALESALREVRQVASGLRLPEMEGLPLAQVAAKAVTDHQRKTGSRVEMQLADGLPSGTLAQK